jgi:hypothetical protein
MEWIDPLLDWAKSHDALLWWLFAGSLAIFVITPIIVVRLVTKLPTDYFTANRRRALGSWNKYPILRMVILVAKNALGIVLLVAGLVMLVAPGQGLLTIVVGTLLVDFPGKFCLQRWLVTRRQVWRSINWLRRRAGRPELKRPAEE